MHELGLNDSLGALPEARGLQRAGGSRCRLLQRCLRFFFSGMLLIPFLQKEIGHTEIRLCPTPGPRAAEPSAAVPCKGTFAQAQSPGPSLTTYNNLVNSSMTVTDVPRPQHLQSKQEAPVVAQLQLAELGNLGKKTSLSQDVPPERPRLQYWCHRHV